MALPDYSAPASRRSAQPCLADDARNLLTDQPLDDTGKMFVEPRLQHRAQHFANDVPQSAFSTIGRQFSLTVAIARQRAELREGSCRRSGCGGREEAFPNRIKGRLARDMHLRLDAPGDVHRR